MADNTGTTEGATWPMPKFHFQVTWGDKKMSFSEVSGLDTETQPIDYRHEDAKQFSTIKMPRIVKTGNVTLKRGLFVNDNSFWDWHNQINMNIVKRETVNIDLLDETGSPTMSWTLSNAWPTKISGADLKSDGNEVAIGTLEVAFETLTVSNS
ncbi:MAG: phage tail protein [Calditrichia bacterium]